MQGVGRGAHLRSDPSPLAGSFREASEGGSTQRSTRLISPQQGGLEQYTLVYFSGFFFLIGLTWQFFPWFFKATLIYCSLYVLWEKWTQVLASSEPMVQEDQKMDLWHCLFIKNSNSVSYSHIQLKQILTAQKSIQLKSQMPLLRNINPFIWQMFLSPYYVQYWAIT